MLARRTTVYSEWLIKHDSCQAADGRGRRRAASDDYSTTRLTADITRVERACRRGVISAANDGACVLEDGQFVFADVQAQEVLIDLDVARRCEPLRQRSEINPRRALRRNLHRVATAETVVTSPTPRLRASRNVRARTSGSRARACPTRCAATRSATRRTASANRATSRRAR